MRVRPWPWPERPVRKSGPCRADTGTAAGHLQLQDSLPNDVTYLSNSALWGDGSGTLTEADDTETGVNQAVKYKYANGLVEFDIASIPALSKGTLSFKVKVNPNAAEKINNTANYKQYKNAKSL